MKARVIETGEWIDVCRKECLTMNKYIEYGTGKEYYYNQLVFENEDKLNSYWFEKRNEYAGRAMQAIIMASDQSILKHKEEAAEDAVAFADALIEQLKK